MKRVVFILLLMAGLALGPSARAQSDSGQNQSLGDVARALRAKKKAELPVITNDNFSQLPKLIHETEQRAIAAGVAPPPPAPVKHAEPQITCSFAFSAQGPAAPAGNAASPQDLPAAALAKLDGPAVIAGGTLQVSIYNGSNWDVQEITVGLTVVKHENQAAALANPARLVPASAAAGPLPVLKKPDETVLYHLKGSAPPLSTTAFKQALGLTLGPNDEWHWAILQARGTPPAAVASGQ
ncbi:MAG TPA: hypothetical protein VKT29_17950 [Terriglobales bacterium]|nr:hypothetical protein [Terriglobales bacterium]